MKICNTCKTEKPLSEYNKNTNCADGYLTSCKPCNKIKRQQLKHTNPEIYARRLARYNKYRADNRDALAVSKKAWDKANSDWVKEYNHSSYWADPESRRERSAKFRADNPERAAEQHVTWRKNNPDKHRAIKRRGHAKRRAAKKNATVLWVNTKAMKAIYDDAINLEALTGIKFHVDHIVPLLGKNVCGLHCEDNLQILTAHENLTKNNSFA